MKIDATDPKLPDWKKYLYPCDCSDNDFLHINWWTVDGHLEDDPFLEVIPAIWAADWWDRIKAIGRIIAGRPHWHGGIVLNPETVERLRETLNEIELLQERERRDKDDGEVEQAIHT